MYDPAPASCQKLRKSKENLHNSLGDFGNAEIIDMAIFVATDIDPSNISPVSLHQDNRNSLAHNMVPYAPVSNYWTTLTNHLQCIDVNSAYL